MRGETVAKSVTSSGIDLGIQNTGGFGMKFTLSSILLSCAVSVGAIAVPAASYAACKECGTVSDVKTIKKEGEGSGLGAVAGGVVGGLLGHQVGSGRGNTAATIVGAGAGAYAGHQVEKHQKSTTTYRVVVTMEDGTTKSFDYANETSFRTGDKVKIVNNKLTRE
jgi:outer membrane lipoprotein SlyB